MRHCSVHVKFMFPIVAFLHFLLVACCAGQRQVDYFENYYRGIYRAEKYILGSNYKDAFATYQQTFRKVPFVFGKDYYNAAVCAFLIGSENEGFDLFEKLITQGVTLEWLAGQKVTEPLKGHAKWKSLEKNYEELRSIYFKTFDRKVLQQLIALDSSDQFFRKETNAYALRMDTIHKIDEANARTLATLMERTGYPGEMYTGIPDSLSGTRPGDFVLIHQTASDKPYVSPIDFQKLTEASRYGKIPPQTVAVLYDAKSNVFFVDHISLALCKAIVTDSITMNPEVGVETEHKISNARYAYVKRSAEILKAFDRRRSSFGLEPSEDFRRKVFLQETGTVFFFGYTGGVNVFHFVEESQRTSFMSGFVEYRP